MQAKKGDKVKVHYTLKLDNGEVVESSENATPLELTIGGGEMIPGFENGIIGIEPGESKTVNISAEQAYGQYDEKKIFEFDKEKAPESFDPQIGQLVRMFRPDGSSFPVTVIGITDKTFKMDANHPLAGKDLIFDLELVEIAG